MTTLAALEAELIKREAIREQRLQWVQSLTKELDALNTRSTELAKVEQTLLHISSKILGQSITNIDTLVTQGLKAVFDDQSFSFSTKTDKSRGKTAVKFTLLNGNIEAPLTESYGGGVLVMVGFLLRVVTIMVLNLRRVLLLDESLAHLSSQYVPNASRLIQRFCAELDFEVIMITHSHEFATHSDTRYKATKTGPKGKEATVFKKA